MKKRMSRAQTNYYLWRARLFWSITRIAEELEVSGLTVKRWLKGHIEPPFEKLPEFEDMLTRLMRELHRKNRVEKPGTAFYAIVADALIEHDPPAYTRPSEAAVDVHDLVDYLTTTLLGKHVKSTDVFKNTDAAGFSRMQVYHAANKLGVERDHKEKGRGGYSIWHLAEE